MSEHVGTVLESPPSVGTSALQKKTDDFATKVCRPLRRQSTAGILTAFFASQKKQVQKKHQNYEEPPFVWAKSSVLFCRVRAVFLRSHRPAFGMKSRAINTPEAAQENCGSLAGSLDGRRAFPPPLLFLRLCAHPTGAFSGARSGNRMRRHSIRRIEGLRFTA